MAATHETAQVNRRPQPPRDRRRLCHTSSPVSVRLDRGYSWFTQARP
jgi:hypothetical protein